MKRLLCLMLAICLTFATSVMVFADDSAENAPGNESRSSATRYFYDNIGNYYKVNGQTVASGYYGYAGTSVSVQAYAGGDPASISGVSVTGATNTVVIFNDGYTTPNYTKLTGSGSWGWSNSFIFSSPVSSVSCTHSAYTDHGGSTSFSTFAAAIY